MILDRGHLGRLSKASLGPISHEKLVLIIGFHSLRDTFDFKVRFYDVLG